MSVDKFTLYVSALLAPTVFAVLKRFNSQAEQENYAAIISGGKALQMLMPTVAAFASFDFDIKIMPLVDFASPDVGQRQQRGADLSRILTEMLQVAISEKVRGSPLFANSAFQLAPFDDGSVVQIAPTSRLITIDLRFSEISSGRSLQKNVVDIIYFDSIEPTMQFSTLADAAIPLSGESLSALYASGISAGGALPDYSQLFNPVGRKGFYRERLRYLTLEPHLHVSHLGYVIQDMVGVLNNIYDFIMEYPEDMRLDIVKGLAFPVNYNGETMQAFVKYARYVAKFERIVLSLSSQEYTSAVFDQAEPLPAEAYLDPTNASEYRVRVCDTLEDTLFACIERFNKESKRWRAVITGGKALQMMFPWSPEFATDDFDLKLVPLHRVGNARDEAEEAKEVTRELCETICEVLNNDVEAIYGLENYGGRLLQSTGWDNSKASFVNDGRSPPQYFHYTNPFGELFRIGYLYEYGGVRDNGMLVDAMHYAPRKDAEDPATGFQHHHMPLEKSPIDGNLGAIIPYYMYGHDTNRRRFNGSAARTRKAYYPETLRYMRWQGDIYLMTIGTAIYDTVYMINNNYDYAVYVSQGDQRMFNALISGVPVTITGHPTHQNMPFPIQLKLVRYVTKYRALIRALMSADFFIPTFEDNICYVQGEFSYANPGESLRETFDEGPTLDVLTRICNGAIGCPISPAPEVGGLAPETVCTFANMLYTVARM